MIVGGMPREERMAGAGVFMLPLLKPYMSVDSSDTATASATTRER